MGEGCRPGHTTAISGNQVSLNVGVRTSRESNLAHWEIFTDSTEVGAEGTNGCREQCGPVQEQGLLGSRVSGLSGAGMLSGRSPGVRSM